MTTPTGEQETTDALIARGVADTHTAEVCPAPDILAALYERTLEAGETERWVGHVADCQRCQALLAAIGRAEPRLEPETGGTTASPWWRWRVLAPLAAFSIVVLAVWVVDPGSMLDRRVAVENLGPPTGTPQATPTIESAETPPTPDASLTVPESTPAAVPPTDTSILREAATPPVADATDAPATGAPMPSSGPAEDLARRREAPALVERDAQTRDAAQPLAPARFAVDSARFAAGADTGPLLVASPDPASRWRVAPSGGVERSSDGGTTWRVQVRPVERIIAGAAPSARVAWLVGENGFILRTTDGERWARVSAPVAAHLTGIEARDLLVATVSAIDGRRFRTVDGGAQWTRLP